MDPFHERLARVGLEAIGRYGFCLAGGYAVQAHGFVERLSKDVDLFTAASATDDFSAAVAEAVRAFQTDGLGVSVEREGPTFARILVDDPATKASSAVELGVDWRAYPPVQLAVGPVLHPDDAVANKLCALFGRAAVRDYIDVHAILASGRYSGEDLIQLATEHDPGFDTGVFAGALRAVRRLPGSAFVPYGMADAQIEVLQGRLLRWADEITEGR